MLNYNKYEVGNVLLTVYRQCSQKRISTHSIYIHKPIIIGHYSVNLSGLTYNQV